MTVAEDSRDEGVTVYRARRGNKPGDSGDRDGKGRFAGRSVPTAKQARFATELGNGQALKEVARLAGYASGSVAASEAAASAGVRKLIDRRRRRIVDQTVSIAVGAFRDIVAGKLKSDPIHWQAVKLAIDLGGFGSKDGGKDSNTKPLHQMSLKELEAMASRINKATSVAIVPELDGDAVQVIEDEGKDTP